MMTGLMNGQEVGTFLRNAAVAKVSAAPMELFAKAIFCNICVCLAVWCSIKMKTETGKIMMAILGVMTFVTSGYEHSVANMTFFTIGLLDPGTAITIGGVLYNLLIVTAGNMQNRFYTGACSRAWHHRAGKQPDLYDCADVRRRSSAVLSF